MLDTHGNNPLWTAVFNARGEYRIIDLIVNAKGDFNSENQYGKTPLSFAKQINGEFI